MLEILHPGAYTSIQDQGRRGLRHLGVAQSGALDGNALWRANRLVGNAGSAAGLEILAGPVKLKFVQASWIALMGAAGQAIIEDEKGRRSQSSGWRMPIGAGATVEITGPQTKRCLYLAIAGGIEVEVVLGARAADLKAGFGGGVGRLLRKGDRFQLGAGQASEHALGILQEPWTPAVRVLPSSEFAALDVAAQHALFAQAWRISSASNRMGFRLQGSALALHAPLEMASHAVFPGIVQLPPNGQPVILLADAQTTGGYPKIAQVIAADLWKVAQAQTGERIVLVETDVAGAARARAEAQRAQKNLDWSLQQWKKA